MAGESEREHEGTHEKEAHAGVREPVRARIHASAHGLRYGHGHNNPSEQSAECRVQWWLVVEVEDAVLLKLGLSPSRVEGSSYTYAAYVTHTSINVQV